jgi:hypothetical protein
MNAPRHARHGFTEGDLVWWRAPGGNAMPGVVFKVHPRLISIVLSGNNWQPRIRRVKPDSLRKRNEA